MTAPTARSPWLGVLTLAVAAVVGLACAPPYPSCRHHKHCKIDEGERCVAEVCQECQTDADCAGEGKAGPYCKQFRCMGDEVPVTDAVPPPTEEPCTSSAECHDGLVCVAGRCGPCTDDLECSPRACNLDAGRCADLEPSEVSPELGTESGTGLAPEYRAWLEGRWEMALQGNVRPDAYEPCRVGRQCRVIWDVDWLLFEPGSTAVHADPERVRMLGDGLRRDPSARLVLVGHAGRDEDRPDTLALARAERVRAWLLGEGLDGRRIEVRGEGASRPIHPRSSPRTRESDRRVEFLLSSDANPVGWWPQPRRGVVGSEPTPQHGRPGATPTTKPEPEPKPAPAPAPAPAPVTRPDPTPAPPPAPAPAPG